MHTHYISFRKRLARRTIRLELAVPAGSTHEARTIAENEMITLHGWRFTGID